MMTDKELDERVNRAVDNFMQGYGCCQSVVAAFADLYGLDDTLAKKIAAGFNSPSTPYLPTGTVDFI